MRVKGEGKTYIKLEAQFYEHNYKNRARLKDSIT
jgi:hypothetical protein